MLIEFALFDAFTELDIICFPQDGQHFVIYLSYSFIRILNQIQYPHQDLTLIQDPLQSHRVENKTIDTMQYLSYKLGIVLFTQKQGQNRFKQLHLNIYLLSIRVQHSAYWQILDINANISIKISS